MRVEEERERGPFPRPPGISAFLIQLGRIAVSYPIALP